MTTDVTAVRHDVPLLKVARRMIKDRWRVLPVLGDDDRVVGMVSRGDLLRAESPPPEEAPAESPPEEAPPADPSPDGRLDA